MTLDEIIDIRYISKHLMVFVSNSMQFFDCRTGCPVQTGKLVSYSWLIHSQICNTKGEMCGVHVRHLFVHYERKRISVFILQRIKIFSFIFFLWKKNPWKKWFFASDTHFNCLDTFWCTSDWWNRKKNYRTEQNSIPLTLL